MRFEDNTENDVFEDYLHISEESQHSGNDEPYKISTIRMRSSSKVRIPSASQLTGSKPKFLKLFESSKIKENSILFLSCQVIGEPRPKVSWFKDGYELRNNSRVNINHLPNGVSNLYINRSYLYDAGVYQVTASNEHGISVYFADVEVEALDEYFDDENVFMHEDNQHSAVSKNALEKYEFKPQVLDDGRSVCRLKCQLRKENAHVDWLKNELMLDPRTSNKYRMFNNGTERVLEVNDVHTEDEGEYVCQSGRYRVTLFLNVNENKHDVFSATSSVLGSDDELFYSDEIRHVGPRKMPRSVSYVRDIYLNEGVKNAELKCKVKHPSAQVEWFKGSQPLSSNDKYEIFSRGTERILLIRNPDTSDNGDYVCQNGNQKVVLNLKINPFGKNRYAASDDESSFIRNKKHELCTNTELTYYQKQTATLKCEVKRDNEPVVWLKDNTRLFGSTSRLNEDKYLMHDEGPYRTLVIKNLQGEDSGRYSCQSKTNPASKMDFRVNIREPKVEFVQELRDVYANNQSDKVVFECITKTPRSVNPYQVKWFKDGKEITQQAFPRFAMYNYCNDEDLDGSVFNFSKLVLQAPITDNDQGQYLVLVSENLHSSCYLFFDNFGTGQPDDLMFKPEFYHKKSQLHDFQSLVPTASHDNSTIYTETVTYQIDVPNEKQLPTIVESEPTNKLFRLNKGVENDLEFTRQLEPFTDCDEEQDCVLECWVNKFNTWAEWYIDDQAEPLRNVSHGGKFDISSQDGRKHRLVIKNAQLSDRAMYTCRINNLLHTSTLLNVNEQGSLRIIRGLVDTHVPEFEKNVEFMVEMNKRVRNDAKTNIVRWFVNKKEVNLLPRGHFESFCVDNKAILKYMREVLFDSDNNSQIECRVQEIRHGVLNVELSTRCRLIVDRMQTLNRFFTKKLDDFVQVDSGLHLDLEARVNFDANVVRWFRNNALLVPSPNHHIVNDVMNRSFILRIKTCKTKDSGLYTIDVDGVQCSGEVKVLDTPLKFVQPLQDTFYDLENETSLTLDCQLNKPASVLDTKPRWFKNGIELARCPKYDMVEEHNICALIIYDLDERDEGKYRCVLGNEKTECRIRPEYTLTKYLPNHVEPRESESCSLSFAVNRAPSGMYSMPITKWYKDGHEISEDVNKYWFVEHENDRSLVIQNCTLADSGLYKAFIIDESAETPISLVTTNSCQVFVQKLRVDFLKPLDEAVYAHLNETVKLYCETVQENLKPTWYHNEILIDTSSPRLNDANKEFYSTPTQHFLIINEVQERDSGSYKIRFSDDQEFTTQVFVNKPACYDLSISPNPSQVTHNNTCELIKGLEDVRCAEGDSIDLEVRLNRDVRVSDLIEWKKNGTFLVNSVGSDLNRYNENILKEFELFSSANVCRLSVKNCHKKDAGVYEVSIIQLDDLNHSDKEPVILKSKCNVHVSSYVEKCEIVKQLPRTLRLNEGETMRLECMLDKQPERLNWYRNSVELIPIQVCQTSVNVLSLDEGRVQILEITNIQSSRDDGTYQLNADDKITICEVKIKPSGVQFEQRPPELIEYSVLKELEDGNDTISIECTINKNNALVKWFKGNQEILAHQAEFADKYETVSEGPIRCLLIHDVVPSDEGEYFCSLGGEVSRTLVKIIDDTPPPPPPPPTKPLIKPKHEVIEVYEGRGIVMGVDLETPPTLTCNWLKDGQHLDMASKEHIETEIMDKKKFNIKIDRLTLKDSGRYELMMESTLLASIDLKVVERPIVITKKLSAKKVENNLLLECQVSKPITDAFKLSWSKDGKELHNNEHLNKRLVNGKNCQLLINNFDHLDSGVYEFSIQPINEPELKEVSSFRLDIKQNPFKTGMRVVNNDLSETRLLQVEFETVNDSFNVDDMKWFKGESPLLVNESSKYRFYKSGPGKFCLEIEDVDANDNGSYQCNLDEFSNKLNLSGIENVVKEEKILPKEELKEEPIEEPREELAQKDEPPVVNELQQTIASELPATLEPENEEKAESLLESTEIKYEQSREPEEPIQSMEEMQNNNETTNKQFEETNKAENEPEQAEKAEIIEEPEKIEEKKEGDEPAEGEHTEETPKKDEQKVECEEEKEDEETLIEHMETEETIEEIIRKKKEEDEDEENKEPEQKEEAKTAEDVVQEPKEKQIAQEEIVEKVLKVLTCDWPEQVKLKEGDKLQLSLCINKFIENSEDIIIIKDNEKLANDHVTIGIKMATNPDTNEETTEIKLMLRDLKESDTGNYKLVIKDKEASEVELKSTELIVEKPLKVTNPLTSDKEEYLEKEPIKISFKSNKPIQPESIVWNLNNKKLDPNASQNMELKEKPLEDGEIEYTLLVKEAHLGENDGEYQLKLLNPANSNETIYSASVKIVVNEEPLQIVDSNWKSQIKLMEDDNLDLKLTINKPIENLANLQLTKNGKLVKPSDHIKITKNELKNEVNEPVTEIKVSLAQAVQGDSGKYQLVLKGTHNKKSKDFELGQTELVVQETPFEIMEPLHPDKTEYFEGDSIVLSIKTSKPVDNSDKCLNWGLNAKKLDLKSPNVELSQLKDEQEHITYSLTIKKAKLDQDDGNYILKIKPKANDDKQKEVVFNVPIEIKEKATNILDSNWQPEITVNEQDELELVVKIDRHLENPKDLLLYKDAALFTPNNKNQEITINNIDGSDSQPVCEIKLKLKNLNPTDSGKYRLCLKNKRRDLLGSTILTVKPKETKPEVIQELKANQDKYMENDQIELSVKLNKKLEHPKEQLLWTLNVKELKINGENCVLVENETKEDQAEYKLVIKSAKSERDQGEYGLKISYKSDEIYSGKCNVEVEVPLELLDSNWPNQISIQEEQPIDLCAKINKPLSDMSQICLYKDKTKLNPLNPDEHFRIKFKNLKTENGEDASEITVQVENAQLSDSGNYKLCILDKTGKEVQLAATKILVEEKPIELVNELKADKASYKQGDNVELSFALSKALPNKDKCISWLLNGKPLDVSKSKQIQVNEEKKEDNSPVVYSLVIKSSEKEKNEGNYTVKVKSRPNDTSELYPGSVDVKIKDDKLVVLESNWPVELKLKENESFELNVKINKPVAELSDVILYNAKGKLVPNEHFKLAFENAKAQENGEEVDVSVIRLQVIDAKPAHSGKFKLSFKDATNKKPVEVDLASTNLVVKEKPFEILKPLESSKEKYVEGEDCLLTFTTSKPLVDKVKCIGLTQNNKPIDVKQNKQFEIGESAESDSAFTYSIKLKAVQKVKNEGEYTVVLKSKPDDAKSQFYSGSVQVQVEIPIKQIDVVQALKIDGKDGAAIENTNFTLSCQLSLANVPVNWTFNGQNIDTTKDKSKKYSIKALDSGVYSLEVSKPGKQQDSGEYKLVLADNNQYKLSDEASENDLVIQVDVKLPALKIVKDLELTPSTPKEEESCSFVIHLSRKPQEEVTWLRNNEPLDVSHEDRFVIESKETKSSYEIKLTIKKLDLQDSASYKMKAESIESKEICLSVEEKVDESFAELTLSLPKNAKNNGECLVIPKKCDSIQLECRTNKDFAKIQWFRNEKTFATTDKTKFKSEKAKDNRQFVYKLTLLKTNSRPSEEVQGDYHVQFDDSKAKSNTVSLSIQEPNEIENQLHVRSLDKPDEIAINNKEIFEKSNIELICSTKFALKETNQVIWYKDGSRVEHKDAKYELNIINLKEFRLKILNCNIMSDSGEYKVELDDGETKLFDSIILNIVENPLHVVKPLVIQGEDVHEGGKVVLLAKVDKQPKAIQWLKDGKPIPVNDKRFSPSVDADHQIKLAIDNLQLNDNGIYTLKVDDAESAYQLIVNKLPVKFVEELEFELMGDKQDVLRLWCMTNKSLNLNDKRYLIQWFKDDKPIELDSQQEKEPEPTKGAKKSAVKPVSSVKAAVKPSKYKYVPEEENTVHVLIVNDFKPESDCANYKIKVFEKIEKGEAEFEAESSVLVAVNDPDEQKEEVKEVENEPEAVEEEKKEEIKEEPKKKELEFVDELSVNNSKPSNGDNLLVSAKLSQPFDDKLYKLQWFINKKPVNADDKQNVSRFSTGFHLPTDAADHQTTPFFEIKPIKGEEEGCLIELSLQNANGKEIKRLSLQLARPLKMLRELKSSHGEYKVNSHAELTCELNRKPCKNATLFKANKSIVNFELLDGATNKYEQRVFKLELNSNKDNSLCKLKLTIENLELDDNTARSSSSNYWLEFDDQELTTNECKFAVKQEDLKFVGEITSPNLNPLESVDNVTLDFGLNLRLPEDELARDVQVYLTRPMKKKELIDSTSYDLVLNDKEDKKSANEVYYRIVLKKPCQLDDSGQYSLKINSSQVSSPNSLKFDVKTKNIFALELPESIEVTENEPVQLQVKCNQVLQAFHWLKDQQNFNLHPTKVDRSNYTLKIEKAKLSDAGVYEFVCDEFESVKGAKHSTRCKLSVKALPEKQIKSLNDLGVLRIKEGDELNLEVKFDKPVDDVKLFFEDAEFISDEHGNDVQLKYDADSRTFTLKVRNVQPKRDEGNYKVKSTNTESQCAVIVEQKPLKFVTELQNVKLKILPDQLSELKDEQTLKNYPRTAHFECKLSKGSRDIVWLVNDKAIDTANERFRTSVSEDSQTHSIEIHNCSLSDSGLKVQIKLSNQKTSQGSLKVEQISVDSLIKITQPLEDCRVNEKEPAVFKCELTLNPILSSLPISFKWHKNNQEIETNDRIKCSQESKENKLKQEASLVIEQCSLESKDQGDYKCQVYISGKFVAESSAKLVVREVPLKLIQELPSTLSVNKGESVEAECILSKPNLKVDWFKDGKLISNKQPESIELSSYTKSEGNYAYKIKVNSAEAKDAGKYKIEYQYIESECKLSVKQARIGIKVPLESQTVKEQANAVLTTQFTQPLANNARIEWFKGGKRLYFSNKSMKYQMSTSGNELKFTIKTCDPEDQGDYELRVYMEEDETPLSQSAQLKVIEQDIVLLEKLTDSVVNEDETAKLSLKTSKPCVCEWYKFQSKELIKELEADSAKLKNSTSFEKIIADDRIVFTHRPDNTFGLTIHDAQITESAFYLAHLFTKGSEEAASQILFSHCKLQVNRVPIDIIIKFPDSHTVKVEQKLKLNCLLSRSPTSSFFNRIEILKDGQPIQICNESHTTRYELSVDSERQLTLSIESAELNDAGVYTLVLDKNITTSCNVKVIPNEDAESKTQKAPKIVQDLKTEPVEALINEPLTFSLLVEGEQLKFDWFHNDKKVLPLTHETQIKAAENKPQGTYEVSIHLKTPFMMDAGKYHCVITNSASSCTSASATLQIRDPSHENLESDESLFQTKPRFIEYFSDVYMEHDTEAQFKCKIIGKPEPKVVWYCNCRKISANEKFDLQKDDSDHYTLLIKNVDASDEGEYTCKASNCKGETSWSANLYLNESMRKTVESNQLMIAPNFLTKIKDSTVSEGHTARLDCYIDGEPFPKLVWLKNNAPIEIEKSPEKYHLAVDEDSGQVSFTIYNALKVKDEDEYMLKLSNPAGVSQCSAYLSVETSQSQEAASGKRKVRFSLPKDSDIFLIPSNDNEIPKAPGEPKISDYKTTSLNLKWTASPSDNEESETYITYIVEYRSSKSYAWSTYVSNLTELSANVTGLTPGLTYSFRIRAENSNGISEPSPVASTKTLMESDAIVQKAELSKPKGTLLIGAKPSIVGDARDVRYYIEGETAEIAIPVFGTPTPKVKWLKGEQEIKSEEAYKLFRDRSGTEHLDIANASEKDEGLYKIVAENEYGVASHEFYLQQADPPIFLEPFKDITAQNHEDVEITCKVDGIPYPEVKFYKDWHLLAQSHRIKIKHIEPDTWTIRIKGAIIRDSGLYTCTAKNIAGNTLSSCTISVVDSLLHTPHPDLKTDLILFKRKKFEEDYEIVEQLSQSPNAKIYRVIERRTAKEYIAKIAYKQQFTEWIKSEADCLNQLNQLNCNVKLHDSYETPSKMFILIFEEIKGKNIVENLVTESAASSKNKFDERHVAIYVKQLLECLGNLHARNIVHLDLNPENIIVDKSNKLKLIGFTHSKSLKPDIYSKNVHETVYHDYGQIEYVSPEVVRNKPITLNTDMWSVGVLTYVLLSGKLPFYGRNTKQTLGKIASNEWQFGDEFQPITHEAKDFIRRLLLVDPQERMTVDQALNHPWIHFASQQHTIEPLDKRHLLEYHSKNVWIKRTKHSQPWAKLVKISAQLEDLDSETSKIGLGMTDAEIEREIASQSFDDQLTSKELLEEIKEQREFYSFYEDDERLNPGTYLLPVKDPLFTTRLREYRRTRDSKVKQIEPILDKKRPSISSLDAYHFNYKPIKERYHIDVYGRCIRRGSLSRSCSGRTGSDNRISQSPSVFSETTKTVTLESKRGIAGEGSAPIVREKLKDMFLIVGLPVTFRCRIEGNPAPRCFWYHNDRLIIGDDDRIKFAQTDDGVNTLTINKARVSDIGVYRCAARNQFGMSVSNARLTVGDTPDRPSRPIVAQYSCDQVYLIWEAPHFNGNSDILCYKIDYKISGDVKWYNALFTMQECCLIKNLEASTSYRFRVSCINTIGISSYSWASEEITTLAPGESKLTIDHEQAEQLLKNQYNLEKRSQQYVLVKKLDENLLDTRYKLNNGESFKLQTSTNPKDLFKIEKKLYEFNQVSLYYCEDKANQTKRLIKFTKKYAENEIKLLRELKEHDRLIQLIEGFQFDDQQSNTSPSYAFVFVHAVPVLNFISIKHKYSEELIVKILRQLIDAVQWVHLHGFVHLNIQPMTILNANLTQVNIKLSGFENAVHLSQLNSLNEQKTSSLSLMPLEFSAPEMLNDELVNMQTDIWNIGLMAALLLSGSSPFYHETNQETTKANISFCRLTFDEFYDDVTGEAVLFIQQCLKRSPDNRLTLQECIDHKLFNLSVSNSKKREEILFLSEKIKCFNHELQKRLSNSN